MTNDKELAYRYDLFVTPDWRDRFDSLVNESVELAVEGSALDVNCGTGAQAIELAERFGSKGEVTGVDPDPELIELARAKAQVRKVMNVAFECASPLALPFPSDRFDLVIGDASMSPGEDIEEIVGELTRVAKPGATVVLKAATHGSFDEFYSIYWEALLDTNLVDEVWPSLEEIIRERKTISEVEEMATADGIAEVTSVTSKEEFLFESGHQFFEAPLFADRFLSQWLAVVPEDRRDQLRDRVIEIIDREDGGSSFMVSAKMTVVSGKKEG